MNIEELTIKLFEAMNNNEVLVLNFQDQELEYIGSNWTVINWNQLDKESIEELTTIGNKFDQFMKEKEEKEDEQGTPKEVKKSVSGDV